MKAGNQAQDTDEIQSAISSVFSDTSKSGEIQGRVMDLGMSLRESLLVEHNPSKALLAIETFIA